MERHATPVLVSGLITLVCLFVLVSLWMTGLAIGAPVGTSTVVHDYAATDHGAINAAMVEASGQFWFAVEYAHEDSQGDRNLDLFHNDGTNIHQVTLSSGELTGGTAGIYPTLITVGNEANVYVVGKENANQTEARLQVFQQDRDDFSVPFTVSNLGSMTAGISHGRAHLTWDRSRGNATDSLYLCWTSKDGTPDSDDVQSRVKQEVHTWDSRPDLPIAQNTGVDDDHCQHDFDHNGTRITVFHSEVNGYDGIFLDYGRYEPTTDLWTPYGQLELPLPAGHTGADFPSLSVNTYPASSRMVVAAKSLTNDQELLSWTCNAVGQTCRAVSQWTPLATNMMHTVTQPKVAVAKLHRFVVYESSGMIRIASMCTGQSTWTYEGELNPPAGYLAAGNRQVFGVRAGDSVQSLVYDRNSQTLHAVYVMQPSGTQLYNPVHWQAPVSDFCP